VLELLDNCGLSNKGQETHDCYKAGTATRTRLLCGIGKEELLEFSENVYFFNENGRAYCKRG